MAPPEPGQGCAALCAAASLPCLMLRKGSSKNIWKILWDFFFPLVWPPEGHHVCAVQRCARHLGSQLAEAVLPDPDVARKVGT